MLAGLLPGNFAQGLFLVLLVPVISEVAAREKLAGTRALVFSQPGVPSSPALWKAAAVSLVVLALGAPLAVKCALVSPIRGLACVAGLLAVAGISVGLGSLSSGGKLFSGLYLAVWYMGLSNLGAADFTSALSANPVPMYSFLYMGLGGGAGGGGGGAGAAGERLRRPARRRAALSPLRARASPSITGMSGEEDSPPGGERDRPGGTGRHSATGT